MPKIGRDTNGNKVIRYSRKECLLFGFSIQTNGNLPRTHKEGIGPWTKQEVTSYIAKHGSPRQQAIRHCIPE